MASNEHMSGHARIETSNFLMIVLITLVVAVGGLLEIVPLFFQKSTTQPIEGLKPYTALQVAGRDTYVREGCYNCHSQMVRPFQAETLRYGPYSVAGEYVYDHPFQWGSKRTGPDLHRVGGRYSDEWHRTHLNNPRDVVPESNMPAYPWLANKPVDADTIAAHMKGLRTLGAPYTDEEIAKAAEDVKGKTQLDAVIAYLQVLGTARTAAFAKPAAAAPAAEAAAPAAAAPAAEPAAAAPAAAPAEAKPAEGKAQ
ncbi:MAG: cytochrome-c oxidase, cbb3-type subunit II [Hydrogenophaga sp.]|nr:cytochrome-c oxidase, cbb3-type subunit II [Hydrogenophaga sp.]